MGDQHGSQNKEGYSKYKSENYRRPDEPFIRFFLQYLLHSYLTSSEEVREEMQDQAVNEMQHLGWLSEELVGSGGTPRIEHTEVDRSRETADMLRADIKIEKEVAAEYDRVAGEMEGLGLKNLFMRLRDHETYHADVFTDLLSEEEGQT